MRTSFMASLRLTAAAVFMLGAANLTPVAVYAAANSSHASFNGIAHSTKTNTDSTQTGSSQPVTNDVSADNQTNSSTPNDQKPTNPTGNNGTLKVHELGTPAGTENNDPKVCAFNLEGFSLDSNFTGYLKFDVQGNDAPHGTAPNASYNFGPTNTSGYAASQYFNNGGVVIPDGHYKVTLYGKDTGQNIDLSDVKAKSKVFKVECETPVTPPSQHRVSAAAPTKVAPTCENSSSYTITATPHVQYRVNGTVTSAGTYTGANGATVTITAEALNGYTLTGTHSWTFTFTDPTDCVIGTTDVCPNMDGDQATVPSGMLKDDSGNCVTPGKGGGDVQGVTTTAALANTGQNTLYGTMAGMGLILITLLSVLKFRRIVNPVA